MFRVKGKGIKNVQGYGWGRSARARDRRSARSFERRPKSQAEEFAALCDEKVNPRSVSFFEKAKGFFKQGGGDGKT